MSATMKPTCIGCGKHPDDIEEYREIVAGTDEAPDDYVRQEEGTYNPANGHFACTDCYIEMGMPSSPRGWVAP